MDLMTVLRSHMITMEGAWGVRPVLTLACAGYADEAWQLWHPEDLRNGGMPHFVIDPTGQVHRHPDTTR